MSTFRLIALAAALTAAHLTAAAQGNRPNAPDIVVSADGKGHFATIQEAVLSVRDYKPTRTTIFVRKGVYREKLIIPANKCDITIVGEQADSVIITNGDYASLNNMGTFRTWTVRVDGSGIRMENLTIENSAGRVGQAVALHVEGDRCEFVGCRLLGNQDTLFCGDGDSRQYFRQCHIEGTTDFIFGPATVWFEDCDIVCKQNSYITAASTPEGSRFGLVFCHCRISATDDVTRLYLGRPWRAYASTVFMQCSLPQCIAPEGWHNWGKVENEKTSRYAEHANSGPGADTERRVSWAAQLTDAEAQQITTAAVMKRKSDWTPIYSKK